jgi:hypothetical protein
LAKKKKKKKATKGPKAATKEVSAGDVVIAAMRKQRYVTPRELQDAMAKGGYSANSYARGIAELRDSNHVVVWVWSEGAYTIKPSFMELFKWCLSNYKTVITVLRRTSGAMSLGKQLAKAIRAKAYQEAKEDFLRIYAHLMQMNGVAKDAERKAA